MSFEKIEIYGSGGKDVPPPKHLEEYCQELIAVPPTVEVFLADPEYDLDTLHSSLAFRAAIVGLKTGEKYADLAINWEKREEHSIDSTGKKWEDAPGVALKYEVTHPPEQQQQQQSIAPWYLSIQFKF